MDVIATADVAVVGAGIAGMSAALEAGSHGVATIIATDGALGRSNSVMAQGGIQIPRGDDADVSSMVLDMLAVGGEDLDATRIERFVSELPEMLSLLEAWGLEFDRDRFGELIRRRAGGLSAPRIVTAGDQIGRPLVRLLRHRVESSCEVLTSCAVEGLSVGDGFRLLTDSGEIRARAVVIAVGGTAYEEARLTGELTSNPPNDNALIRSSLRALGLSEVSPRRFQWHPFGLVASKKGITVSCVPESVAALGPMLVADGREVAVLPSPRSQVVAAMREVDQAGSPVTLTLSDLPPDDLLRFPNVQRYISRYGAEPQVTPVLHYELSGFETAMDQSTAIPGLYLAGEIVGGIHGKERLMGAGVADSLVHGRRAGESAVRFLREN